MIAQSVGCSLGCSHSQLGKPVNLLVSWCFRLRHGRLRAPIGSFSEGRGPWGARAVESGRPPAYVGCSDLCILEMSGALSFRK